MFPIFRKRELANISVPRYNIQCDSACYTKGAVCREFLDRNNFIYPYYSYNSNCHLFVQKEQDIQHHLQLRLQYNIAENHDKQRNKQTSAYHWLPMEKA